MIGGQKSYTKNMNLRSHEITSSLCTPADIKTELLSRSQTQSKHVTNVQVMEKKLMKNLQQQI